MLTKTFNEEQDLHFFLLKLQSNWAGFSMNICWRQIRQSSSVIAHISSLSNIWRVSKPLKDLTYYFNQVIFAKMTARPEHFWPTSSSLGILRWGWCSHRQEVLRLPGCSPFETSQHICCAAVCAIHSPLTERRSPSPAAANHIQFTSEYVCSLWLRSLH